MTTTGAAPALAADPVLDLENLTAAQLEAKLQNGSLTSVQLTRVYVNRIAGENRRGPGLSAVRVLNANAIDEARASDARRRSGAAGTLEGLPVIVKDNLDVAGMPTTAGSIALEGNVPATDSPVVVRLRSAGAVLLAKANLSEYANFFSSGLNPSGYSSLGGQVLNANDATATPSGSSSGSAVSASTGLAALTIGTETSGSIISPSAANSDVGLRPTVGLVPRTGIVPISASQDTAGSVVRSVRDAALELCRTTPPACATTRCRASASASSRAPTRCTSPPSPRCATPARRPRRSTLRSDRPRRRSSTTSSSATSTRTSRGWPPRAGTRARARSQTSSPTTPPTRRRA